MLENPLLLKSFSPLGVIDILIIITGWFVGNILFNNFEKHLHYVYRFKKFIITIFVFLTIGILFGKIIFYGLLFLMTLGQIYLHARYFPKHGVNGLTAEPYEKYLELIEKVKRHKI